MLSQRTPPLKLSEPRIRFRAKSICGAAEELGSRPKDVKQAFGLDGPRPTPQPRPVARWVTEEVRRVARPGTSEPGAQSDVTPDDVTPETRQVEVQDPAVVALNRCRNMADMDAALKEHVPQGLSGKALTTALSLLVSLKNWQELSSSETEALQEWTRVLAGALDWGDVGTMKTSRVLWTLATLGHEPSAEWMERALCHVQSLPQSKGTVQGSVRVTVKMLWKRPPLPAWWNQFPVADSIWTPELPSEHAPGGQRVPRWAARQFVKDTLRKMSDKSEMFDVLIEALREAPQELCLSDIDTMLIALAKGSDEVAQHAAQEGSMGFQPSTLEQREALAAALVAAATPLLRTGTQAIPWVLHHSTQLQLHLDRNFVEQCTGELVERWPVHKAADLAMVLTALGEMKIQLRQEQLAPLLLRVAPLLTQGTRRDNWHAACRLVASLAGHSPALPDAFVAAVIAAMPGPVEGDQATLVPALRAIGALTSQQGGEPASAGAVQLHEFLEKKEMQVSGGAAVPTDASHHDPALLAAARAVDSPEAALQFLQRGELTMYLVNEALLRLAAHQAPSAAAPPTDPKAESTGADAALLSPRQQRTLAAALSAAALPLIPAPDSPLYIPHLLGACAKLGLPPPPKLLRAMLARLAAWEGLTVEDLCWSLESLHRLLLRPFKKQIEALLDRITPDIPARHLHVRSLLQVLTSHPAALPGGFANAVSERIQAEPRMLPKEAAQAICSHLRLGLSTKQLEAASTQRLLKVLELSEGNPG